MITGCTHIAITKLDVLNEFDTISAVEKYKTANGETTQIPFDPTEEVSGVTLSHHPGWKRNIAVSKFEELPDEVRTYLTYLEGNLKLPISFVSLGPGREELLVR